MFRESLINMKLDQSIERYLYKWTAKKGRYIPERDCHLQRQRYKELVSLRKPMLFNDAVEGRLNFKYNIRISREDKR